MLRRDVFTTKNGIKNFIVEIENQKLLVLAKENKNFEIG